MEVFRRANSRDGMACVWALGSAPAWIHVVFQDGEEEGFGDSAVGEGDWEAVLVFGDPADGEDAAETDRGGGVSILDEGGGESV